MVGLRLPQELTDEIISFVEDDRETLAYASLVCRAWLQCSRRRLFRSIKLDGPSAVDFLNYLSVGQGGEDADASASSAKDIRKLRLVGSGPSDQGDNLYVGVILRMLSLLPNLEHLSVEHGTFVASQEQLDAATVSLKELRILNAHVPLETPQALLQLLSIFNRIDSLYLSSLTWDSVSVDPAGAASSPIPAADQPAFPLHLQVSCFTLVSRRRSFIPAILALMQRTKSIHTLSDIRLQCNDAACITAAGAFLSHPNAVVRSLSVDLAFPTGGMTCVGFEPAMWRQLNIGAARSLTHLSFITQLELTKGIRYAADQFLVAPSLIDECSDALESITFFCWVDLNVNRALCCLYSMVSEFLWLRSTLLKKPRLRKVRWLWRSSATLGEFSEHRAAFDAFIVSKLSGLRDPSILEFDFWNEDDTTLGGWFPRA